MNPHHRVYDWLLSFFVYLEQISYDNIVIDLVVILMISLNCSDFRLESVYILIAHVNISCMCQVGREIRTPCICHIVVDYEVQSSDLELENRYVLEDVWCKCGRKCNRRGLGRGGKGLKKGGGLHCMTGCNWIYSRAVSDNVSGKW